MSEKIMLVAGESSGDLHAGHLARSLKAVRSDLQLFGFGGTAMRQQGVDILADPTQIAVIGIFEVLKHLPTFRRLFDQAVRALEERRPDGVVLVDYPGFNLRFAKEVKRRGIRLIYYISPQIWAWDPGRIRQIRRLVDRMIVIFPFEKELYEKAGVPVTFVGHPLLDLAQPTLPRLKALETFGLQEALPIIGLLPGSREVEIRRILPILLKAAEQMNPGLPSTARFLLIKAPHLPWELYREFLSRSSVQPKVVERWDYDGIHLCDLALVASGTATLECALLERPMLIIYKTSWPTYLLGRLFLRIPMIGLVNVAFAKGSETTPPSCFVVPEFIQRRADPRRIAQAALALWNSASRREEMRSAFRKIRSTLGSPGAAQRAAQAVLAELDR